VPAGIEAEAVPAQIARITAQAGKEGAKAMASKNLGAVIQRAISDGAFRRQLQSDPAAALRGFNLSPDEVAAIRSGDSGKLMSLGIDQRMSKAFAFSGTGLGGSAVRSSVADLNAGSTSNALTTDNAASRDGIIGDPGQASREAISTGTTSGTRAINDNPPFEGNVNAANDPTVAGTRVIHDSGPVDLRSAAATGDFNGTRSVNDVAPFGTTGSSAIEDPNSPEFAAAQGTASGTSASGGNMLAADDNFAVSSRMADAGDASSIRSVNDVEPFEGNVNAAAAPSGEFLGGDARLDPGTDSAHSFIPSDSADVQREMLDGHGDALGNTGGGNTSS